MNARAQIRLLADGKRLHLSDGPIDIVLQAFGATSQIHEAYGAAADRFLSVLDELCAELPLLRKPVLAGSLAPAGRIAGRMFHAVLPYAENVFITSMAAVAGAVAEEILHSMNVAAPGLSRAYVNDGGDIALHIGEGEHFSVGMVDRPEQPSLFGTMLLDSAQPVRGIATSGWRGRSFSFGIADAVTVLARTAAGADAAATIISNAVDLPSHPAIIRRAACELAPDSDLRDRLVTVEVGRLPKQDVRVALGYGAKCAANLINGGLIEAAALRLQGETRVVSQAAELVESERLYVGKSGTTMVVHA